MPKLLTRTPFQRRVEEHAAIVKNTMRKVKIKDTVCRNLWRELVYPLRRERAKVQTSIDYYARKPDADPYQRDTTTAYLALLVKLEDKLVAWQTLYEGKTPKQMALEKGVANHGAHWSDWIPTHIRDHFVSAYQNIAANRKGGRARTPFEKEPAPKLPPKRPRRVSKAPIRPPTPIEELRDQMKIFDNEMLSTTDPHRKEELRMAIIAMRTEQDELRKERSRRRAAAYYLAQKTKHANIRRQVREKLKALHGATLNQPHGESK
jgi:hypothetical protein